MGTPAANQLESVLSERFPGIRFGRVNCRYISGTTTYSQHSWNNARDIYPPRNIPYLASNDGEYRQFLDDVWEFILANQESLNIRVKLWQVRNHYNHIHVDFWPRGWSTPPCAGGASRYKFPDGRIESVPTLINEYQEADVKALLTQLVRGAYASGHPALIPAHEEYWLRLVESDPESPEFADLWKAVFSVPEVTDSIAYGQPVILAKPEEAPN